jgi:DNA polymerase I-like protein with 3'-5' exonuclease and polymerase domains
MLPLFELPTVPAEATNERVHQSKSYKAVLNCRDYNQMVERIALSNVCAVDTEADGTDSRVATLFGISFALACGDAFFVPFCQRDMGNLTPNVVKLGLRKLFKQRTRFVGHNLKYDFALLRRNGIDPPLGSFDTLLAAYDCYGDLDFFNLPFLAQKLLGRKIKAYKDIVPKEKTFLELPFDEMKEHGCSDADVTLQLYKFLQKELKERRIDQQFERRTMPLAGRLIDLEKLGVPVDGKRLEHLCSQLLSGMLEAKKRISDSIGIQIDLDSQEEIFTLITEKLGLRDVLRRKSLPQSLVEQLSSRQPLLKPVVEYKRKAKQLRRVQSIIKAIRRGRVYPLFSQTQERDGRISSTDPDLFADDGLEQLLDCVGGELAMWFHDSRKSLKFAEQASGDLVVKKDLRGQKGLNRFMRSVPIMSGLHHDDLLFRVLIGESPHQLSARFLVDQITSNGIILALETRYSKLFQHIRDLKAQALKWGYVERDGMRRYFDGLKSSSIEKRNKAQVLSCRWWLQY